MNLDERADAHAALGDVRRLLIADHLAFGDHTVAELTELSGMRGNLLAHHLDVLESAGLIERRVSEGDHRRKYISLRRDRLPTGVHSPVAGISGDVVFVCTRNSARSQFAAALWQEMTGEPAGSAGREPSPVVHPKAVEIAAEFGLDISEATPAGYERITTPPSLVVSVCDLAREGGLPEAREHLHWSVRDPVPEGTVRAFRTAFNEIADRIGHLAAQRQP